MLGVDVGRSFIKWGSNVFVDCCVFWEIHSIVYVLLFVEVVGSIVALSNFSEFGNANIISSFDLTE